MTGDYSSRVWRGGGLEGEDFPLASVSDYLDEPDTLVWIDLCSPSVDVLHDRSEEHTSELQSH